jgi:hypothetical protein
MTDIVERMENVIKEVDDEGHPVTFAALVERADSESSSYDLIVSSPWFLEEGKSRSYIYLSEKLKKYLQKEDWQEFNRVLLMNPDEKFIQDLTLHVNRFKHTDFMNLRAAGINLRYAHVYAAPGSYFHI